MLASVQARRATVEIQEKCQSDAIAAATATHTFNPSTQAAEAARSLGEFEAGLV